jgi:transcriptional regulator with XRE-family HTH domain
MNIGRHIRVKRKALGLKQHELAHDVDVTPQHISQLEREDARPSLETLLALSRTLGVTADYLLTGREAAPLDIRGAIRAQPLSPASKRSLIQLVGELSASD